jgi:hypothetical protein
MAAAAGGAPDADGGAAGRSPSPQAVAAATPSASLADGVAAFFAAGGDGEGFAGLPTPPDLEVQGLGMLCDGAAAGMLPHIRRRIVRPDHAGTPHPSSWECVEVRASFLPALCQLWAKLLPAGVHVPAPAASV